MVKGVAAPHEDRHSLRSEVPTRVAILFQSARHKRHKAINDLPRDEKVEELDWDPLMSFRGSASLV
jgi:hypothetical protein